MLAHLTKVAFKVLFFLNCSVGPLRVSFKPSAAEFTQVDHCQITVFSILMDFKPVSVATCLVYNHRNDGIQCRPWRLECHKMVVCLPTGRRRTFNSNVLLFLYLSVLLKGIEI